jgi:chromosome segregation ATPase
MDSFEAAWLRHRAGGGNVKARLTIAVLLAVSTTTSFAQTERSGNADARVMQQLQQLTSERAALQADNAKLKQDLEKVRKELEQAAAGKKALEGRTKALEVAAGRDSQSGKQAGEQLERTRAQLQELIAKFRETAQTLRDVETERAQVKNQLATREREFKTCVDRNAALYNLNTEVLERFENRGFWSSLTEREPFTRLKRVELENLSEEYKYRADELRLQEQQRASAAQ